MAQTANNTAAVDSAEKAIDIFEKVGCPSVAEFIKWLQKDEQKDLVQMSASTGLFSGFSIGGNTQLEDGSIVKMTPIESMIFLAQSIVNKIVETPKNKLEKLEKIFEELVEINRLLATGEFVDREDVH